jgi:tetratricopeptide (TPR) repeat protein
MAVLVAHAGPSQASPPGGDAPPQAQLVPISGVADVRTLWKEKMQQAERLRTSGRLDDALKGFETALETARSLGEQSSYVGMTLSRIGGIYLDQGQHQQAEMALSRALSKLEKSLGPEHIEVGDCLAALGACHRNMGHYAEAESAFGRALAIAQKAGRSAEIAAGLFGIGLLYSDIERHAQAVSSLQSALRVIERQRNPDPGILAGILMYLENDYLQQGRFQDGEPLLRRALRTATHAYGPGAPQVASAEHFMAVLECARANFAQPKRPCDARSRPLKPRGAVNIPMRSPFCLTSAKPCVCNAAMRKPGLLRRAE